MNYETTITAELSPNQRYWEQGLKYFEKQETPQVAMQNLWDDLPPPGNLDLLATIIGNLYADYFWSGLQLDVEKLAVMMNASLGINISDCRKSAGVAYRNWYGLLVRANFGNDGSIPKNGSTTESPDVIVNGLSQLTPRRLIELWNQTQWGPEPGLKNYTYARAQSKGIEVPIKKPQIRMFYTDNGFNPPPSSWIKMYTYDDKAQISDLVNINGDTKLGPGDRSANNDPFGFTPQGAGHFCVIACAVTEFFSNNPPTNVSNWNSATWLRYNGAAGWHNLNVSETGEELLKFYNPDDTPQRFRFVAHCRKLPAGSEVTMEASDVALSSGATIEGAYQEVVAEVEVPAHYEGAMKVTFPKLPDDASIDWQLHWRLPPGHENHLQAMAWAADGAAGVLDGDALINLGSTAFVGSMD